MENSALNLNDFNPKLRLKNLNLKKIDSNLVNSSLCFEKNHRIAQHSFERYLFFFPGYVIFPSPLGSAAGLSQLTESDRSCPMILVWSVSLPALFWFRFCLTWPLRFSLLKHWSLLHPIKTLKLHLFKIECSKTQ